MKPGAPFSEFTKADGALLSPEDMALDRMLQDIAAGLRYEAPDNPEFSELETLRWPGDPSYPYRLEKPHAKRKGKGR